MANLGVRRDKAALSSGCKSHPATAPAGSNRSSYGGMQVKDCDCWSILSQKYLWSFWKRRNSLIISLIAGNLDAETGSMATAAATMIVFVRPGDMAD